MAIKIQSIVIDSLSYDAGLQRGDLIQTINSHTIRDFLDLQFYASEEILNIKYLDKNKKEREVKIHNNWVKPLGIEPEAYKCRNCINKCIFCFIDQMKPFSRKTLHVKDDDYCFSFIYGNFVTLTNFTDLDFRRIIEQNLSPLYISVHTTNPVLHKKMMRYNRDFNINAKLEFLAENEIEMHTQIVLIPDYNDKKELTRTLKDLTSFPEILSIGIVPVGLTQFRNGLEKLNPVDKKVAINAINEATKFNKFLDENIVFCSDELYLIAEKEIPDADFYGDYVQLENGIGMLRLLQENWEDVKDDFLSEISNKEKNIIFVTAKSASKTIKKISDEINISLKNKTTSVQIIKNNYLGESVTVAGLICATDIFEQLKFDKENDIIVLPESMFNIDDYTLDQISKTAILKKMECEILLINELFENWKWL